MKKRIMIPLVICGCFAACVGSGAITNAAMHSTASVSKMDVSDDKAVSVGDQVILTVSGSEKKYDVAVKSDDQDRDAAKNKAVPERVAAPKKSTGSASAQTQTGTVSTEKTTTLTEVTTQKIGSGPAVQYESVVGSVVAVSEESRTGSSEKVVYETEKNGGVGDVVSDGLQGATLGANSDNVQAQVAASEEVPVDTTPSVQDTPVLEEEAAVAELDNTVSYAKKNSGSTSSNYDPGEGFETADIVATETCRVTTVTYPKKTIRLIKRTVYYENIDFKINEYYVNGKIVDEDDYKDEYEDALEDMWKRKCSMEVTSCQNPILVQDKVRTPA